MRLLLHLLPFRMALIGVIICVVIYTLLGLVGPYLIGLAIDKFIGGKDPQGLINLALLMLVTYFFFNLFTAIGNWVMARVSQRALKNVRRDLFEHLQKLSIRFYDTHSAGELMSRPDQWYRRYQPGSLANRDFTGRQCACLVGIVVAMFILNHWLALATLLIVPIMVFLRTLCDLHPQKASGSSEALGRMNSVTEEAISGQKWSKHSRNESVVEAFREGTRPYTGGSLSQCMPLCSCRSPMCWQFLCDRAGQVATWHCKLVSVDDRHVRYAMRLHQSAAADCQYIQRHPGCIGEAGVSSRSSIQRQKFRMHLMRSL
jgi:ATP-binding cassette subfamily B protein